MVESTTSKSASSYGSASASAVCQVSSQTLGGGRGPADVEQLGRQVGGGHLGPAAGGREGRGPGAGGDVEDALPGLHVDGLDEDAAERCDDLVDDGPVAAAGPHGRVLGLERPVLGGVGDRAGWWLWWSWFLRWVGC